VKVTNISSKGLTEISSNLKKLLKPKKEVVKVKLNGVKGNIQTEKVVIIVRDGIKIMKHKVWIYGAPGKFVQTGEKITKQGSVGAGVRIKETVYYKSIYGYNSKTRIYFIEKQP
jgi:hypothetical protein